MFWPSFLNPQNPNPKDLKTWRPQPPPLPPSFPDTHTFSHFCVVVCCCVVVVLLLCCCCVVVVLMLCCCVSSSFRWILLVFLKTGTLQCARLGSRVVVWNPGGPKGWRGQNFALFFPLGVKTPKIQRKDPEEREERMKIVAGDGKKKRNFGRSGRRLSGGGPLKVGALKDGPKGGFPNCALLGFGVQVFWVGWSRGVHQHQHQHQQHQHQQQQQQHHNSTPTTHQQHTTTHNNTQQHTTTHNNTQQHTTTHNNTQQHTTTHNNTQQHTQQTT